MSRYDSFCNMPLSQGVYRCYTSNWMQIVKCDFIEVLLKRFHELPYQDHYECSIALLQSVSAADHSESCKRANASRTEVREALNHWSGLGMGGSHGLTPSYGYLIQKIMIVQPVY
jgi:hypothetical protein